MPVVCESHVEQENREGAMRHNIHDSTAYTEPAWFVLKYMAWQEGQNARQNYEIPTWTTMAENYIQLTPMATAQKKGKKNTKEAEGMLGAHTHSSHEYTATVLHIDFRAISPQGNYMHRNTSLKSSQ